MLNLPRTGTIVVNDIGGLVWQTANCWLCTDLVSVGRVRVIETLDLLSLDSGRTLVMVLCGAVLLPHVLGNVLLQIRPSLLVCLLLIVAISVLMRRLL